MLRFNEEVFDEFITGTAATWYTAATDNGLAGSVDNYSLFALTTNVSGTTPTITIYADQSGDNQTWDLGAIAKISGAMSSGLLLQSGRVSPVSPFVRFRITLGGTDPECRLQLTITGREF